MLGNLFALESVGKTDLLVAVRSSAQVGDGIFLPLARPGPVPSAQVPAPPRGT